MFRIIDRHNGTLVRATRSFDVASHYSPRHYAVEMDGR